MEKHQSLSHCHDHIHEAHRILENVSNHCADYAVDVLCAIKWIGNRTATRSLIITVFVGIGEELVTRVPGCSVFLFGYADIPEMRGLAEKRRSLGWFRKTSDVNTIKADIGMKPSRKYGITG